MLVMVVVMVMMMVIMLTIIMMTMAMILKGSVPGGAYNLGLFGVFSPNLLIYIFICILIYLYPMLLIERI